MALRSTLIVIAASALILILFTGGYVLSQRYVPGAAGAQKSNRVSELEQQLARLRDVLEILEVQVESRIGSASPETQAQWHSDREALRAAFLNAEDKVTEIRNARPKTWKQFQSSAESAISDAEALTVEIQKRMSGILAA